MAPPIPTPTPAPAELVLVEEEEEESICVGAGAVLPDDAVLLAPQPDLPKGALFVSVTPSRPAVLACNIALLRPAALPIRPLNQQ